MISHDCSQILALLQRQPDQDQAVTVPIARSVISAYRGQLEYELTEMARVRGVGVSWDLDNEAMNFKLTGSGKALGEIIEPLHAALNAQRSIHFDITGNTFSRDTLAGDLMEAQQWCSRNNLQMSFFPLQGAVSFGFAVTLSGPFADIVQTANFLSAKTQKPLRYIKYNAPSLG